MVKPISLQNKKGVSELVSYTLLIIIAIAAGVLVFGYLKVYVPKDRPVCPDEISLSLPSINCAYGVDNSSLSISFVNRGRFTIDAAYIRIGLPGKSTKTLINSNNSDLYFASGLIPSQPPLNKSFSINNKIISNPGSYILEVEPAVTDKNLNVLAACDNAIISQDISC